MRCFEIQDQSVQAGIPLYFGNDHPFVSITIAPKKDIAPVRVKVSPELAARVPQDNAVSRYCPRLTNCDAVMERGQLWLVPPSFVTEKDALVLIGFHFQRNSLRHRYATSFGIEGRGGRILAQNHVEDGRLIGAAVLAVLLPDTTLHAQVVSERPARLSANGWKRCIRQITSRSALVAHQEDGVITCKDLRWQRLERKFVDLPTVHPST